MMKFKLLLSLGIVSALFAVSCIGDEPVDTVLEIQEPIEVPMVVETQVGQTSCESCVRGVVRKVVGNRVVERVVVERPVVETVVQVTRVRRRPVRTMLRRMFCR